MTGSKFFTREVILVAAIILIAVVLRVGSFAYLSSLAKNDPAAAPYPVLAGDSKDYAHYADNLLVYHAYEDVPGEPLRAWPPGYPILLAIAKGITGSTSAAVIIQLLFSCLALWLMYLMSRRLLPAPYRILAPLVYALDPMAIVADSSLWTDGIFSALVVCVVYIVFFQEKVRGPSRPLLAGLLLGAAIMIRPIAEFLIIIIPITVVLRERFWSQGERAPWWGAGHAAIFLLGCIMVLTPWVARNQILFGSPEISNIGPHDLLLDDVRPFLAWEALRETPHPMAAILVKRHDDDPIFSQVDRQIASDLARLTPPGQREDSYYAPLAFSYIFAHPLQYAYFHAVNTVPFFISSSGASYGQIATQLRYNTGFYAPTMVALLDAVRTIRHPQSAQALAAALRAAAPLGLEILWWAAVSVLALFAAFVRRREFLILLSAGLVAYFALLTGPLAAARYRVPAEPYLLMLAAAGTSLVVERAKKMLGR